MKNSQLRKRFDLIEASVNYEALTYPEQVRERNSRYSLMRTWAYFPDNYKYLGKSLLVDELKKAEGYSNEALKFSELTKYSTWFAMHPEKVAGQYKVTTSIHFPLTIVADNKDVVNCIKKGIEKAKKGILNVVKDNPSYRKSKKELKLEAEANLNLLKLLELELTL